MSEKLELLQKLIDANNYDAIKARNKMGASRVWWFQYLETERKELGIQYKKLTGEDLDKKPEEAKPESGGGGGDGKHPVAV